MYNINKTNKTMKKLLLPILALALMHITISAQDQGKRYNMYSVMFYNLENLFDTINNNGVYDLEFSPHGARQWNGQKYWQKQIMRSWQPLKRP